MSTSRASQRILTEYFKDVFKPEQAGAIFEYLDTNIGEWNQDQNRYYYKESKTYKS